MAIVHWNRSLVLPQCVPPTVPEPDPAAGRGAREPGLPMPHDLVSRFRIARAGRVSPEMGREAHRVAEPVQGRHDVFQRIVAQEVEFIVGEHQLRFTVGNLAAEQRDDQPKRQSINLGLTRRNPDRQGDVGLEPMRPVDRCRSPGRWQDNLRHAVGQGGRGLDATGYQQVAGRVDKGKLVANSPAKGAAAIERHLRQDRGYPRDGHVAPQGAADPRLGHGGADIPRWIRVIQPNSS